ncbi:unnamed protein product, partial [Choristocarpus tenellus]
MAGVENWEDGEVHSIKKNGLSLLSVAGAETTEEAVNSDRWLKVVVVRDPVERMLSGFLDKCTKRTNDKVTPHGYLNCPYLLWMPELFNGETWATPATRQKMELLVQAEPELVFAHFVYSMKRN